MEQPMSDSNLDLSSPAKARKALADLVSEQKRLKDANRSLSENMDKKSAALTQITQRMSELEASKGAYSGNRGDGSLSKYVRRDGSVRMKGEATDKHAYMPGLLDDTAKSDWQFEFQNALDDYNLTKSVKRNGHAPKAKARLMEVAQRAPNVQVQRLFADEANKGGDWIPDVMLPQLERNLTAGRKVAGIFDTVPMSDKTIILPFLSTGYRPYKKAALSGADDPAQYTSSSMVTDNRTITASGFAVRAQVDADSSEDSILAALPLIRQELVEALISGEEDCIINGNAVTTSDVDDYANWNIRGRWGDDSLGTSTDHRRAWTGLRHRAFDTGTPEAVAETFAGVMKLRSTLASPHGSEGDCVIITSPEVYLETLLQLEQVATLEKWGSNYTALSGQLSTLGGMPVIISEFMSADMAATGLYTGSGNQSGMLVLNKSRFKLYQRAGAAVEIDKDVTRGVYDLVASSRQMFASIDAAAKQNVVYGIDFGA